MHVRACCCQSSWLKHPFVQKRGEMQCHCSDSSVTPDPLCSVPFVRLWGKRKLLCGLLVTMPCSQTTKGTSWQYQPAVLRWDFALMWGKKPISCICKNPGVPTGGKKRSLIIKAAAAAPLAQRQTLLTEQSLFWVCSSGQFIDGWQEAAPCCSTKSCLTWCQVQYTRKRSKSCWNTGDSLRGKKVHVSVCQCVLEQWVA